MSVRDEWKEPRADDFRPGFRWSDAAGNFADGLPASEWNVKPMACAPDGRIASGEFAAAIFADRIGYERLNRIIPNPFPSDAN